MANALRSKDIRHPNMFSLSRGITLLSNEIESINQSIGLILSTSKGELFGDPTFGSQLKEMLFDYTSNTFSKEIQHMVADELNAQETRIITNPDDIGVTFEGSTVTISILYNIRYTDITNEFSYVTQTQEGD